MVNRGYVAVVDPEGVIMRLGFLVGGRFMAGGVDAPQVLTTKEADIAFRVPEDVDEKANC